ncbi:MAG: hypothetical protein KJZ73_11115 [Pseudorhodoplanes sp.]|nr:hypothetical protein [Pseudorhodoplanes sp.]
MLRWVSSLSDVTDCTRRDWAGTWQTYGLVWGLPIAAIVAGLFLNVGLRTAMWTIALGWMGAACLLNAHRCGRTHCRYTGPFYLVMIFPVLAAGLGIVSIGLYGWLLVAAIIVLGSKVIWWLTESAWGKFSRT